MQNGDILLVISFLDIFVVFKYYYMALADKIKKIREDKGLMQKGVAAEIGLKPAHYNKIEKGMVEPSVEVLDKLAAFYGISIDDIVHFSKTTPKAVTMEDKSSAEQLRLLAQLNEKYSNEYH